VTDVISNDVMTTDWVTDVTRGGETDQICLGVSDRVTIDV